MRISNIIDQIKRDNPHLRNIYLVGIITRGQTLAERIAEKLRVEGGQIKTAALDSRPYRDDLKEIRKEKTRIYNKALKETGRGPACECGSGCGCEEETDSSCCSDSSSGCC